jgi:methylase of polypeptide subunit release factors
VTRAAPASEPGAVAEVRRLLRAAGYTQAGIQAAVGTSGEQLAVRAERPVYVRRLRDDGPLATLIRLFILDLPLEEDEAERALGTAALRALETLRLVRRAGSALQGAVRLVPHDDLLIASDPPADESHVDHVPGMHRPSAQLAHLTVRSPVRDTLDVGTGSGIQALLAARHSERVVAVDVNERALAFAELNAALNEAGNVELVSGSYLEPVRGQTFDLVVANPPYAISPESEYLFRDSGLGRDRVSQELVREVPSVLAEGGFATVMVSWAHDSDEAVPSPVAWLEGAEVDAIVLHTGTEDALTTAAAWNRDKVGDEEAYGEAIDRWLRYYEAEGIAALAYGSVVMRRRSGANWVRPLPLPLRPVGPAGAGLLRLFRNRDFLEGLGEDDGLLDARLRVTEGAVIERRAHRTGSAWADTEASLRLGEGLRFSASLDPMAMGLVLALDGERSVGAVLAALAEESGLDSAQVRASGLPLLRGMLEAGFVEPARAQRDEE